MVCEIHDLKDAGIVIDIGDERYDIESYEARVIIYRDKNGNITAVEIEKLDD